MPGSRAFNWSAFRQANSAAGQQMANRAEQDLLGQLSGAESDLSTLQSDFDTQVHAGMSGDSYSGPTSVDSTKLDPIAERLTKARALVNAGAGTAVDDAYNGYYSPGERQADSIAMTPNGSDPFAALKAKYGGSDYDPVGKFRQHAQDRIDAGKAYHRPLHTPKTPVPPPAVKPPRDIAKPPQPSTPPAPMFPPNPSNNWNLPPEPGPVPGVIPGPSNNWGQPSRPVVKWPGSGR